ncbi:hypothetical protein A2U01_0026585, partial [Trifolium medium]|nr:hypothetical protein [Trifolium medium]
HEKKLHCTGTIAIVETTGSTTKFAHSSISTFDVTTVATNITTKTAPGTAAAFGIVQQSTIETTAKIIECAITTIGSHTI